MWLRAPGRARAQGFTGDFVLYHEALFEPTLAHEELSQAHKTLKIENGKWGSVRKADRGISH